MYKIDLKRLTKNQTTSPTALLYIKRLSICSLSKQNFMSQANLDRVQRMHFCSQFFFFFFSIVVTKRDLVHDVFGTVSSIMSGLETRSLGLNTLGTT